MAYSLCKIYGSIHSARVIYYAMYSSVHSERRRGERGKTWVTVNIHNEITMPTMETKYEKNNIA
jgi:hypothetical protein